MGGAPIVALSGCDRELPPGDPSAARNARLALLKSAFSAEKHHSAEEVSYYIASLELLYTCSLGLITAAERVCASLVKFDDCMHRLLELYEHNEPWSRFCAVKTALLLFFVHIFVDTNAKTSVQSLTRSGNGILSLDAQLFDTEGIETKPLCERLCDDLAEIAAARTSTTQSELAEHVRYCEAINLFTNHYFDKVSALDLSTNEWCATLS
jgi:hypothetical protein